MIKRLIPYFNYLIPVRYKFIAGILFGILFSISSGLGVPLMAETVFPVLFGNAEKSPEWLLNLANVYFDGELEGGFLIMCCLTMPLIIFIRTLAAIGNAYFMTFVGVHVIQAIQTDMFRKVQFLPLSFLNKFTTGEMNAAVMGYPTQIKAMIVDTSNQLIKEPLTLISAIAFLTYKSFTSESFFMAIIGMMSIPPIILLIRRVGNYLLVRAKQLVKMGEMLGSWTIESFQSPVEIRAYNLQGNQIKNFKDQLKQIFVITMKSCRFGISVSPLIELISSIGIAAALYLGVSSGMGEGEFLALVLALYMAYGPIKKIGAIQNSIKVLEEPLNKLEKILHAEETISSPLNPVEMPLDFKGDITFDNVTLEYKKNQKALNKINLKLRSGESYAIVGKSGSGKSSFVNLILRLYDPQHGNISIDGINIKNFNLEDLRGSISYVPQTPIIFNATFRENILIGNLDANNDEVIKAAKYAQIHEYIEQQPEQYDTIISERGISLSGGQRQKISIARAFLKNAPIIILDEATSSLDNEADADIKNAIKVLSENKTTIFISHRISSIRNINNRIVFHDGKIIASGNHEQLLKNCPEYAKITNVDETI